MPQHSVFLVRCALLWFITGVLIGVAMLVETSGGWLGSGVWVLRPSHAWIMLTGFMIQLALGVALWILPRSRQRPGPGRKALLAAALVLNLGVVVVTIAPLVAGWLWPTGMGLQIAGIGVLVGAVWPRIQSAEAIRRGLSRKVGA